MCLQIGQQSVQRLFRFPPDHVRLSFGAAGFLFFGLSIELIGLQLCSFVAHPRDAHFPASLVIPNLIESGNILRDADGIAGNHASPFFFSHSAYLSFSFQALPFKDGVFITSPAIPSWSESGFWMIFAISGFGLSGSPFFWVVKIIAPVKPSCWVWGECTFLPSFGFGERPNLSE